MRDPVKVTQRLKAAEEPTPPPTKRKRITKKDTHNGPEISLVLERSLACKLIHMSGLIQLMLGSNACVAFSPISQHRT